MMARTSLDAYDRGAMITLKETIYGMIAECNMLSNRDIASILGRDTGTVSGRTNELKKEGRIRPWSTKRDPVTEKMVQVWEVCNGC